MVAEAARAEGGTLPLLPAERLLSRALRAGLPVPGVPEPEAAFGSIEVRILPPENLTEVPENPTEAAPLVEERDVVLGRDETLEAVLRANAPQPGGSPRSCRCSAPAPAANWRRASTCACCWAPRARGARSSG